MKLRTIAGIAPTTLGAFIWWNVAVAKMTAGECAAAQAACGQGSSLCKQYQERFNAEKGACPGVNVEISAECASAVIACTAGSALCETYRQRFNSKGASCPGVNVAEYTRPRVVSDIGPPSPSVPASPGSDPKAQTDTRIAAVTSGCDVRSINAQIQNSHVKRDSGGTFLTFQFLVTDACPDNDENESIDIKIRITGTQEGETEHVEFEYEEQIHPSQSHQRVIQEETNFTGLDPISNVEVTRVKLRRK